MASERLAASGSVNPGLPSLELCSHVDAVAEDDETSDSARASIFFISLSNLSSDTSTALEPENWRILQNVIIKETPKHARHPASDPSPDDSTDPRPRRVQEEDLCVGGLRTH